MPAIAAAASRMLPSPGRARLRARVATAVLIANSGASGPSTAPKDRDARAASTTEAICRGPISNESSCSGMCPPWPGSWTAAQVSTAPSSSIASTHQSAASAQPNASGSTSQMTCWISCSTVTKATAPSEASRPTTMAMPTIQGSRGSAGVVARVVMAAGRLMAAA